MGIGLNMWFVFRALASPCLIMNPFFANLMAGLINCDVLMNQI